jgi:hypothetical protein
MAGDPHKTFYEKGYAEVKAGKKRRSAVPYNFKLSYVCGRYDAIKGKPSRYQQKEVK